MLARSPSFASASPSPASVPPISIVAAAHVPVELRALRGASPSRPPEAPAYSREQVLTLSKRKSKQHQRKNKTKNEKQLQTSVTLFYLDLGIVFVELHLPIVELSFYCL